MLSWLIKFIKQMKTTVTIFLVFIATFSGIAQQEKIAADSLLTQLQSKLKSDWNVTIRNDTLSIESSNYIWIDFYNSAGAPVNDPNYSKYTDIYLQNNGEKTKMKILFEMQDKWDSLKIKRVSDENKKINSASDSLIYKYNLSHVKRTYRYSEELIWNATKDEEGRFEKYKNEKEQLSGYLKELPLYNSEKYSLFIISRTWVYSEDQKHYHMIPMIYPESEGAKIGSLENTINAVLKNKK
jgi:hypothetical protein